MKQFSDYINTVQISPSERKKLSSLNIAQEHYIFFTHDYLQNYNLGLKTIQLHSPSSLKYSRTIEVTYNSNKYFFKISDIHIEIDFELLGVNEMNIFQEVFNQIRETLLYKKDFFVILCVNFSQVKKELLNIFYSFMNYDKIRFIFLTDKISFLSDSILNKTKIFRCENTVPNPSNDHIGSQNLLPLFDKNKNELIKIITKKYKRNDVIQHIRDNIYNILIRNCNIYEFTNELIGDLVKLQYINNDNYIVVMKEITHILERFNNNYRSIFHLEHLIVYLMNINNDTNYQLSI